VDRNRWSSKHTFNHDEGTVPPKTQRETSTAERIELSQETIKTIVGRIQTGFYDSSDAASRIASEVMNDLGRM
jgi:hypothetical protein